ncbi:hypothetical protein B7494_g2502 [Chlorociboria aeruginascens]|nr:hypothetical protein B7494_g2502 [Chlorociboria aeruginascens]
MLRNAFRSPLLRGLPRTIPRPPPPTSLISSPPLRQNPTPFLKKQFSSNRRRPRLPSSFPYSFRSKHARFDPEAARNAKPLFTSEQFSTFIRSRGTIAFSIFMAGGMVIFYFSNIEEVPVSGRKRFNCYSEAAVEREGRMMYRKIMSETAHSILPERDPRVKMVKRVMERLIMGSGLENVNWEVHVIESQEKNAFVIPGGKVFVYTGILPIAKNDDGLATILGHEIAHNLAQHAAESMSRVIWLQPFRFLFMWLDATGVTMGLGQFLGDIALQFGVAMPASRKQESEADFIGLMMMAKSCYNPNAAPGVWRRMEAAETHGIPQWLSTHPSSKNRITQMESWLMKAETARSESGCAETNHFTSRFQDTLGLMNMRWD